MRPTSPTQPSGSKTLVEELKDLNIALKQGLVSQATYEAAKSSIHQRMQNQLV